MAKELYSYKRKNGAIFLKFYLVKLYYQKSLYDC